MSKCNKLKSLGLTAVVHKSFTDPVQLVIIIVNQYRQTILDQFTLYYNCSSASHNYNKEDRFLITLFAKLLLDNLILLEEQKWIIFYLLKFIYGLHLLFGQFPLKWNGNTVSIYIDFLISILKEVVK